MARGGDDGIDAAILAETVERALNAMEDVRKIKLQLSGATTGIEKARDILEEMAGRVRAQLEELARIVAAADSADTD
jgi:hypothetical protein